MFRKVLVTERLPEIGKKVITIDVNDNPITYIRTEDGWNMPALENNHEIKYWLEEIEEFGSKKIIGNARQMFENLKHKNWDWSSFYNGWLEGRMEMLFEIKKNKNI